MVYIIYTLIKMVSRSEIKQAALKYCDNFTPDKCGICNEDVYDAFISGANWANEHLIDIWHDASEEPKIGYDIVVIDRLYQLWVIQPYDYCNECNLNSWKCYVRNYNDIQKWTYISDLLPKGGQQ